MRKTAPRQKLRLHRRADKSGERRQLRDGEVEPPSGGKRQITDALLA
jgi:hypothetical protein